MTHSFFQWLNLIVCMGLVYSVFCRGAKSGGDADIRIKVAFVFLAFCAYVAGIIPFAYPQHLIAAQVILALAITNLQHVTGQFWHRGTPDQFKKR